jgi:hypothetical protein
LYEVCALAVAVAGCPLGVDSYRAGAGGDRGDGGVKSGLGVDDRRHTAAWLDQRNWRRPFLDDLAHGTER